MGASRRKEKGRREKKERKKEKGEKEKREKGKRKRRKGKREKRNGKKGREKGKVFRRIRKKILGKNRREGKGIFVGFSSVDGVFWYTKHVHSTLVWICLWN
jgi:hypothetical protein